MRERQKDRVREEKNRDPSEGGKRDLGTRKEKPRVSHDLHSVNLLKY